MEKQSTSATSDTIPRPSSVTLSGMDLDLVDPRRTRTLSNSPGRFFHRVLIIIVGPSSCLMSSGPVLPLLRLSTGITFGIALPKLSLLRKRFNKSITKGEADPPSKRRYMPNTPPLGFTRLSPWPNGVRLQSGAIRPTSQPNSC